jgi:hypothetical protein
MSDVIRLSQSSQVMEEKLELKLYFSFFWVSM